MYFSTIFSNSLVTMDATTIFIKLGSGISKSPLICNTKLVDFILSPLFSRMAQLPDTSALPSDLMGDQTTVPLALLDTYFDA